MDLNTKSREWSSGTAAVGDYFDTEFDQLYENDEALDQGKLDKEGGTVSGDLTVEGSVIIENPIQKTRDGDNAYLGFDEDEGDWLYGTGSNLKKIWTIGDIKHRRFYKAPSTVHPWFCLNQASKIILSTVWPDYVEFLKSQVVTFFATDSENTQSVFEGDLTTAASGLITLDSGDTTTVFLNQVYEQYEKNGVKVRAKITNVTQNETKYGLISLYSLVNLQIEADWIPDLVWADDDEIQVTLMPHIVYDESYDLVTDKAYHVCRAGDAFMGADDSDGRFFGGLGRRHRMKGHAHGSQVGMFEIFVATNGVYSVSTGDNVIMVSTTDPPIESGDYGPVLLDTISTPPASGVFFYEFGGIYNG